MKRLFILGTFLLAAAAGQPSEELVGGPYVVHAGSRQATIMWVVKKGDTAFGTAGSTLDRAAPVLHAEKTILAGLKAGETYYYDIKRGDRGRGSFKAPPARGGDFSFMVYGDTRSRHDVHRKIIQAILQLPTPDFLLHTGDLVADGNDPALWPTFFEIEGPLLRKTAFFPLLGNHERNARGWYEFFDADQPYYAFDWGNAHFAILDSDMATLAGTPAARDAFWTAEVKWLEEDLAKSQGAAFRFVAAHHPPISAVANRQGGNKQMTALMPLFEKYKVSAGFFGHDHNYQHYLKNGVHYVVTGGGGAPLYDVSKPPEGITQKVVSSENFVAVSISGNTAKMEARAPDGAILDSFTLDKPAEQ